MVWCVLQYEKYGGFIKSQLMFAVFCAVRGEVMHTEQGTTSVSRKCTWFALQAELAAVFIACAAYLQE